MRAESTRKSCSIEDEILEAGSLGVLFDFVI